MVSHEGRELQLRAPKKGRSVLAVLLLRPNQLVPTGRIVDELWGEESPPTAVKAVQVYVSQLRKSLGPGVLETALSGYRLRVEPGALDLERFETLLEGGRQQLGDGDAEEAGASLRAALALWRGPPLAEFEYEAFARNEIGRLEGLRLAALELRLEADLALGRHAELIGELQGLVRDHPLSENLSRILILALYRAGRQADALAVYQEARTRLVDQLGLDPGPALQELEKQILRQDADLILPTASPRRAAAVDTPAPVAPSRPAAPAARKIVSVVCCDMVAYDPQGEQLDPEALRLVISRSFERAEAVIGRHGGLVENAFDGGIMAVFGVPAVHEDDALRALRAALELVVALPELGAQARIGVATGEVVAGGVDGVGGLVTGDPVAVGKRLEQAAAPSAVLIDEPTLALVGGAADVEAVEPLDLAGRAQPVAAFRVVDVREAPRRADTLRFVGRERELAFCRAVWDRVQAEQRCELLTIVADGGVGKSRLAAEMLGSIEARVVQGRCLPYGEGITYWPVIEVLEQLSPLPSQDAAAEPIRSLLGETETVSSAEEIAWAFRRSIQQAAAERPLALLFDDIHWGEELFLDLVEQLAFLSSGTPVLLLCMARPELLERRPSWPVALRLEPLGGDEVDALIPEAITGPLRAQIARAAGGNPLFIQEMLAIADEEQGEVVVPPTLKAVLAARLDQLDPRERSALARGAVEGEVFHTGALLALAPEEAQVATQLSALVRRQLIAPDRPELAGEEAFRFRHLLIRDAAYDALPKATRAEFHERFAVWLDEHPARSIAPDEIVAHHLEQSYRYRTELGRVDDETRALGERAGSRLAAAGLHASGRGDLAAAANLLGRAAALLPPQSPERIEAIVNLVEPLAAQMRVAEVEALLDEASAAAAALGEERLAARVEIEKAWLAVQATTEPFSESAVLGRVEQAMAVSERLGDEAAVARALEVVTTVHHYFGRLTAITAASQRGSRHAERAHNAKLEGKHRIVRMAAAQWGPTPLDQADDLLEEDLAWARRTGSIGVEACATVRLGVVRGLRGDREAGSELFDRGMSACVELGARIWAYQERGCSIWALTDDLDLAEAKLRESCDVLDGAGKHGALSTVAAIFAECLYRRERYDEAAAMLATAAEKGADDDVATQVNLRAGRAKLEARHGKLDHAESLARDGVTLAAGTEFVDLRGDSLLALSEVLRLAHRETEAAAATEEALALWEAKGNVVYAERTRAILATLTPASLDSGRAT
jgi:DNA-binding SARP family transcriptional activator